jgi:hypothetical protein
MSNQRANQPALVCTSRSRGAMRAAILSHTAFEGAVIDLIALRPKSRPSRK